MAPVAASATQMNARKGAVSSRPASSRPTSSRSAVVCAANKDQRHSIAAQLLPAAAAALLLTGAPQPALADAYTGMKATAENTEYVDKELLDLKGNVDKAIDATQISTPNNQQTDLAKPGLAGLGTGANSKNPLADAASQGTIDSIKDGARSAKDQAKGAADSLRNLNPLKRTAAKVESAANSVANTANLESAGDKLQNKLGSTADAIKNINLFPDVRGDKPNTAAGASRNPLSENAALTGEKATARSGKVGREVSNIKDNVQDAVDDFRTRNPLKRVSKAVKDALPGSSNPVAENADLARQKIGQGAEKLKDDIKDATNTNKGLFGSVKSSVQSGVDQVKDAASSVTPSSNPLKRTSFQTGGANPVATTADAFTGQKATDKSAVFGNELKSIREDVGGVVDDYRNRNPLKRANKKIDSVVNPLAENADLARQDISRKGENLRENIKDATPSFGSIKASVKSGVDQVKDAASSVTPSSNPLKRVTESVKSALPSSNPIADNADLNKLGQSAERLKNDVQTATNTNKGPFGSVKSSVQSGVDQVKDAASSVTPSSNPLQRVTESVKNALPGSSNPVAENADLARQKIGQKAEGLKEDIKDTTNTNKGLFGSVKSSVQSGVDQVKEAADSVTSANPLKRTAYESNGSSFNPVFQTAELGVGIKDKLGPKTEEVGASTKGAANDFKDSAREALDKVVEGAGDKLGGPVKRVISKSDGVFPTSGEGLKPTENLGRADDLKANVSNQNPVVPRTGVDLQLNKQREADEKFVNSKTFKDAAARTAENIKNGTYPRDNKNEFGLGQTPAFVKDGTNFKTGANKDPADGEPRVTPRSLLGGDARAPAGKSTPSQPISPLAVGDGGNKDKTPYVRE